MESLKFFIKGKKATIIGKQPHPLHWVAAEDYAGMVSKAYNTDKAAGKKFFIFGPEAYTMKEALDIYTKTAHPGVKVKILPIWMARLIGGITFNKELKSVAQLMSFFDKFTERGDAAETNEILMVAYMNAEALAQTIETGNAVYFSRSRKKLWKKGEQSGHTQKVQQILTDCDQDCQRDDR